MAGTAKGPLARPYIIQDRRFGQERRLRGSVLRFGKPENRRLAGTAPGKEGAARRFFLSELRLRPPEKLRQWMFARQIRTLRGDRYGEPKRAGGTLALRKTAGAIRCGADRRCLRAESSRRRPTTAGRHQSGDWRSREIALCRWKSECVNLKLGKIGELFGVRGGICNESQGQPSNDMR